MQNKKVSIIIPCYNKAEYVEEAVKSAVNQTYDNVEIVIVNDASTDNTEQILEELKRQYEDLVVLKNEVNLGVMNSRNKAISFSTGEYILPLDADDTIEPTYVEKAVKILDEKPDIGIVYCRARLFGDKNEEWNLPKFVYDEFIFRNCIFCTAMFRKTDFEKVGGFKDYMTYGWEDFDLWLSILELGRKVYQIDEILFNYRKDGESLTTEMLKHLDELRKIILTKHINLYVNNEEFMRRVFFPTPNRDKELNKEKKKHKKYKKLFNICLVLFIITLIISGVITCLIM